MPEWTPETGFEEAKRRIAVCAETRAEELDLGGLYLVEVPEELLKLSWLKRLYLGADAEKRSDAPHIISILGTVGRNVLRALPSDLAGALQQLHTPRSRF